MRSFYEHAAGLSNPISHARKALPQNCVLDNIVFPDILRRIEYPMRNVPNIVFAVLLLFLFLTLFQSPVLAAGADAQTNPVLFGLGIGIGRMDGNTLYHIRSSDIAGNTVESELKFPLQTTLLGLNGSVIGQDGRGRDQFSVSLHWWTNIDNGSGKLEDSDWLSDSVDIALVGSPHPGLDIYSTSDISQKTTILDLRGWYNFWPAERVTIGPLGGFLYQHFSYDASNLNQVGFGPYATLFTGSVPGKVLTYEVTYTIPYIGAHSEMRIGSRFAALIDLGYAPYATAEDRDDHILRYKESKGSTSGDAFLAAADGRWEFTRSNSLSLRWEYIKITTTGTQTQTWYFAPNPDGVPAGTSISGIYDKITSEQTTLSLFLNHRF